MKTRSHEPQGSPSWSCPSVAPALPRSKDFRRILARATKVFVGTGIDPGKSNDSLERAAALHDAHFSRLTHFSGTPDSKNGLVFWRHLLVLSQKPAKLTCPHTFFMRNVIFDSFLRRPLLVSVSSALVFDVSNFCGLSDGHRLSLFSTSFSSF